MRVFVIVYTYVILSVCICVNIIINFLDTNTSIWDLSTGALSKQTYTQLHAFKLYLMF